MIILKRRKTINDSELILVDMHLQSAKLEMIRLAKKYLEVGSDDADYILQSLKHLATVEAFIKSTCGAIQLYEDNKFVEK